jgi:membrane fusion protein (multidrug efflux system)
MADQREAASGAAAAPPSESRSARGRMTGALRSRRRVVLPAAIAVVLLIVASWWMLRGRESTDDARVRASIHPIAPRVQGMVVAVHVKDNQAVAAGDVLFEIDRRDFEVARDRRRADLEEATARARAATTGVPVVATTTESALAGARATVDDARAGVRLAEKSLAAAEAGLSGAEARLRQAQAEHARAARDQERLAPLVERDEISKQEYDAAVENEHARAAAVDAAQASVTAAGHETAAAESRLAQARAEVRRREAEAAAASTAPQRVTMTEAEAASAEARVEQASAELRRAELDLEYTVVRAPVSGVVARKSVEVGEFVRPGQAVLAVVALDEVWVVANFKETQVRSMRPGQRARVEVDAYPGRDYEGHVESIGAATTSSFSLLPPENASGNFVKVVQRLPVKIVFDQPQDRGRPLRPGMSVIARVYTRSGGRPAEPAAGPAPDTSTASSAEHASRQP